MDNRMSFLKFIKQGDFSKETINNIKEELSLSDRALIRKTFKVLNSEIGSLDENLYYVYIITNCTNLLSIVCDENKFDSESILVNRIRIKKSREALLALSHKYKNEELLRAANKLDEIILDKSIDLNDLIKLIKELIDRKEDFNIIKKLLNTNKGVLLLDKNELFDYAFNKAMTSIVENTADIYYYIALLKIFYSSKIDKTLYEKIIIENFDESNEFVNEIYLILHGHKRELTQKQILSKYFVLDELKTVNIINPNKTTTDDYIISIDSDNTILRDDAISIKKDGNNYIVGIHIADPALVIEPDSIIDYQAKNNYSCTYLSETSTRMLADNIERSLTLDKDKYRRVLSMYVVIDNTGEILHYYLAENVIKTKANLSYSKADFLLSNSTTDLSNKLRQLYYVSKTLESKNIGKYLYWDLKENDSIEKDKIVYKSDLIINELMVLYNHLIAKLACDNNIPYVYRTQSNTYLQSLVKKLDIKLDDESSKIINSIYLKSKYSTYPMYHNGLKLDIYSHSSSPLRRYPDLYNQFLIHNYMFNDVKFNFDSKEHDELVDYFNQRSIELSLMRSEYSRAIKPK